LLSAHVYQDGTKELPKKFESLVAYEEKEKSLGDHIGNFLNDLDIDKVVELSQEEEKDGLIGYLAIKAVASGGYYGQAYLDRSTDQLVIAHRGTDNLINTFAEGDDTGKKFGTRLLDMVRDLDDDYEIFSGKIPREQITFESPGTAPLIEELEDLVYGDFDYKKFDPSKAKITTYNTEPNSINTLHQHIGKVIPLYEESKAQKAYSDDFLFGNISQHSIDTLLLRFDQRTGKVLRKR